MQNTSSNFFSGAPLPRLAMINSFAGFGRCSTTISLPVISAMQVQVCPVPTTILSNHLAFPKCHHVDYTPYVGDYIDTWHELDVRFDGLYCGFLGNSTLVESVAKFVRDFKPPVFLLDPVMGDNGKTYSSVTPMHCEALRQLAAHATLLTPNLFEACLLTQTDYTSVCEILNSNSSADADDTIYRLCMSLREICPGDIVISGVEQNGNLANYILHKSEFTSYAVPKAGGSHHGTGDLFASILIADTLYGRDLTASVKKAADFISLCIQGTEASGAPKIEGVLFEKYLSKLILP